MSAEAEKRSYSAFISYRHAKDDSRVAREIHRKLERYHLDRDIREKTGRTSLAPIFRDEDELPISSALDDDLISALRNSSALIVVCSPRTNESTWVAREVDEFLKTHDQSRVFVALVEGEPHDVVPPRLLKKQSADGTFVDVEPLAANFREECKGVSRHNEVTRLAAGILAVPYDSLVKRAQRRRQRITAALVSAACAATTIFGVYNAYMNARISSNYQQAMQKRSEYLATEANRLIGEGNTLGATELALAALPDASSPDTLDRPVVPGAVYALQQATNAGLSTSVADQSYTTTEAYGTTADLRQMRVSPNGAYVVLVDESEVVATWDVATHRKIFEGRSSLGTYENVLDAYVLDSGRTVIAYETGVVCRDEKDGTLLWDYAFSGTDRAAEQVCLDTKGQSRLLIASADTMALVDLSTGKELASVNLATLPEVTAHGRTWTALSSAPCVKDGLFALALSLGDDTGFTDCLTITIDAQTLEVKAFDIPGLYAFRIGLAGDGKLVALLGDDPTAKASDRNELLSTIMTSTRDFDMLLACSDARTGEQLWSQGITTWQISFDVGFGEIHAPDAQSATDAPDLACWLSDRIMFIDLANGEVRNELRTASSLVGGGVLADGVTFMGVQADGSLFEVNEQSDSVLALQLLGSGLYRAEVLPSGELYLMKDNYTYAYRGAAIDKNVYHATVGTFHTSWEFEAPEGFLVVTMPTEKDALKVELREAPSLKTLWETSLGDDDGLVWSVLSYDEKNDELLLQGMAYDEASGFPMQRVACVHSADRSVEKKDVLSVLPQGCLVPAVGEAPRGDIEGLVVGSSATSAGDTVFSQVVDEKGAVGIAASSLQEGTTTLYAAPDGFGAEQDSRGRRLYLLADPTGKQLVCQDVAGAQEGDSGLTVHQTALIDLASGTSEVLEGSVATVWDATFPSRPLNGHVCWSDDGATFAYVSSEGVTVRGLKGLGSHKIALDGRRVEAMALMGNQLLVGMSSGFSQTLESYDLVTGEQLATSHLDDGSSWVQGFTAVPLGSDGSGNLFVATKSNGYLVDASTLSVCQRFAGGCAYSSAADVLLCRGGDSASYNAHERYSLVNLVERGHLVLGDQTMGDAWLAAHGAG